MFEHKKKVAKLASSPSSLAPRSVGMREWVEHNILAPGLLLWMVSWPFALAWDSPPVIKYREKIAFVSDMRAKNYVGGHILYRHQEDYLEVGEVTRTFHGEYGEVLLLTDDSQIDIDQVVDVSKPFQIWEKLIPGDIVYFSIEEARPVLSRRPKKESRRQLF